MTPEVLTASELNLMSKAGRVAAEALGSLSSLLKPGLATKEIEVFLENRIKRYPEMTLAFKGFRGYPAACCVSVNEEVIHGIPSGRQIKEGDVVSVDLGIKYRGLFVDTARTYIVGKASPLARRLLKVTWKSLYEGIKRVSAGARVGDISAAVQKFVEKNGFAVIRKFVGHGIGKSLHLPPEIPNFGEKGQGAELRAGYTVAIEPMVSAGSFEVDILEDGWTAKTRDNSLAAHFEHTVAVTDKGPWVLTR